MLASITPLGERSRRQRWLVTVTAHLAASAASGLAVGALLAGAGGLAGASARASLAALALVLVLGVLLDLRVGGLRLPTHRRQVDRRWLGRYRGWVYGAGFGAQLGTGIATVTTTSAVYATLAGCALAPTPGWGCAIGAAFGLTRGATPLLAAHVTNPAALLGLHRRLVRLGPAAAGATIAAQSALAIAATVVGAGWLS